MKLKKGFTLTEVLVVIVIISLIVAIAVPSILAVNKRVNARMLESKKDIILAAAELYGKDNPQRFVNDEIVLTVGDLLNEDYIEKDTDKNDENCLVDFGCIINPVDKTSLNDIVIVIKRDAKDVAAVWDGKEGSTSSEDLVELVKEKLNCPAKIEDGNPCLFVGSEPNNYLWYSGIMWRIIGVYNIDGVEVVKMITDDNVSFES